MIKIVSTSDKNLNRNYNGEWKNATNNGLADKIDCNDLCSTPQSDVDMIAAMMDSGNQPTNEVNIQHKAQSSELTMSPMERDVNNLMQNYIRQNGSVVQDDNKTKRNQTLFG